MASHDGKIVRDESGRRKRRAGRPRKFEEPSRPITVTLPHQVLELLEAVNTDRAKAITKVTYDSVADVVTDRPPVRLIEVERGISVIVVGHSKRLRELPWLRRVEIAPGQFLLLLTVGTSLETLELAIIDLISSLRADEEYEYHLLGELRRQIGHLRRERRMSKSELILVHHK